MGIGTERSGTEACVHPSMSSRDSLSVDSAPRGAAAIRSIRDCSPVIAPSLLKCDFGDLAEECHRLEAAGLDVFHWDVMDGHFVPNLSYGAMVINGVRPRSRAIFDVHLMISDPGKYLDEYIDAGCDLITFHLEAVTDPRPLLQRIRDAGRAAGLAISPQTPVTALEPYFADCQLVLVMSVEPGFGGQKFQSTAIKKVSDVRRRAGPEMLISIDGGIGSQTIAGPAAAGANLFVAGSSIFNTPDYLAAADALRAIARAAAEGPKKNQ